MGVYYNNYNIPPFNGEGDILLFGYWIDESEENKLGKWYIPEIVFVKVNVHGHH